MTDFLDNLLTIALEAAPWLVLGLAIGGLIKSFIPTTFLQKHLSGNGFLAIVKAALFGAPLPLCSCGVIPAALGLRRAGASKSATVSFLVSTPETGIDSVSISYALLGPFMAIVRPIAAIVSAIVAGLLVGRSESNLTNMKSTDRGKGVASCCSTKVETEAVDSCCATSDHQHETHNEINTKQKSIVQKAWAGIVYSFTELLDNVLFWMVIGLIFAALVKTFVPVTFLAQWGSGLPAMLIMLLIGIPMYVCATASTPIAAGLLLAGVSPGTAMVFLMAGPATNISTLGIIGKELGRRSLIAYLSGVGVVALLTGVIVDYAVNILSIDVQAQISHSHGIVPPIIAWAALLLLIGVIAYLNLKKRVP
ncbi:MAG: SO_0444 family Cu/Zn efflux transporter [Cocleimonas sp.]